MKKVVTIFPIFILLLISNLCCAQTVSLGEDGSAVYNTLYDRVNSYNRSQGDHYEQAFTVNHLNGVISEIIIGVKEGYLYDLGLNSHYEIHYLMNDGLLDRISTQYKDISVSQLKTSFNKLYGAKHIDDYYFSDDYKTYKTVSLANNGLATVEERSSSKTHFPAAVRGKLDNLGVLIDVTNKKQPNADSPNNNYNGTGNGGGLFSMAQRSCIYRPIIDNPNHLFGKIAVDLQIDKTGTVIYAHAPARGTTLADTTLWRKCEQATLNSKFSSSDTAPDKQEGKMYFIFKVN